MPALTDAPASPGQEVADPWSRLQAFSAALKRGETRDALAAARDACLAAPNMAEAHYAYGQAWMAEGKPERAEQAFAIAAKLRPGFADAWVNYGLARYAQGAIDDAKILQQRSRPEVNSDGGGYLAALSDGS